MKYYRLLLMSLVCFGFLFSFSSCTDEPEEVVTTQADLNAAVNVLSKTSGGSFAHGGPDGTTGDQTNRDMYSDLADPKTGTITEGTIITKRTFVRNTDGSSGDLYVTFAMIKREADYWPEGGDWEYVKMPYDANVDYTANPNGMLPSEGDADRGKLAGCQTCHAQAEGNDFLYSR